MPRPWAPHVTVSTVTQREDGLFLFVEENIDNRLVINQPSGHWEAHETLMQGALRETFEETGWHVALTGFLGVYEHQPASLDYTFLRFAFAAKPVTFDADHMLDAGIHRSLWLSAEQLREKTERHRSPMVQCCVDDFLNRPHYPIDLITHFSPHLLNKKMSNQ